MELKELLKFFTMLKKVFKISFIRRDQVFFNDLKNLVVDLPSPRKISYWWKFGSLLGIFLGVQIVTGLFLAMHYVSEMKNAFRSVDLIVREVGYGWFIRLIHSNGASAFFLFLYLHIGRGLYYYSFFYLHLWMSGVTIFILSMAAAFLGYVLPWGNMSYWGATVITNLASVVPFIGSRLVSWIWGGFAVGYPTLTRFFALHFLCPFLILGLVLVHVIYLHETGSNNPMGLGSDGDKVPFHPYFRIKDAFGFCLVFVFFLYLVCFKPYIFMDCDKFIEANPLVTPVHIQPEWYFLPAYAVLRSIPKKLGGVVALAMFLLIYYFLPYFFVKNRRGLGFLKFSQFLFWFWIKNIFILLWIGARPVEDPFILIGRIRTMIYFLYFFIVPLINFSRESDS